MNNVALNSEVYEQLKKSAEQIKYKEPEIDIEEDIKKYVHSLKIDDKSIRESKLEDWIRTKLQPSMIRWKQKYFGANNLLNSIHTQINSMKKILHTEQTNINNIQHQITNNHNQKILKESEIDHAKDDNIKTQYIDLPYEKKRASIFILFSIVIAFATYLYFINNQISLKWATKTPNEKAKVIVNLVKDGDMGYINYILSEHKECLRDEESDKVIPIEKIKENIDFSCIDTNKLENAPKPSLSEALSEQPILFILAFSGFLLMLMGKVTASVYEKLKYPHWLFYLFYILAGIVLISTAIVSSSLSSLQIEKNQIVKQISSMEVKKSEIEKAFQDTHYDELEDNPEMIEKIPEVIQIEKEIQEKEKEKPKADEAISKYSFWVSLLIMLTELIMGSIAWMTYSEYIKKRKEVQLGGGSRIEQLNEELQEISKEIENLKALIKEKEEKINTATDIQGKLSTLLGEIHTNEQIENIARSVEESIIGQGKALLQEAEMKWYKEHYE